MAKASPDHELNQRELIQLVETWYRLLDQHAPVTELLPLLHDKDLLMEFPEGTLRGQGAFSEWLATVVRIFFDEEPHVDQVDVAGADEQGWLLRVTVNWKARRWKPPAPRSEWLDFDAYQTWRVQRSARTGRLVIVKYVVDRLVPRAGSVEL